MTKPYAVREMECGTSDLPDGVLVFPDGKMLRLVSVSEAQKWADRLNAAYELGVEAGHDAPTTEIDKWLERADAATDARALGRLAVDAGIPDPEEPARRPVAFIGNEQHIEEVKGE